jgi:alpha-D-xyloside xylohydrolase
MDLKYLFFSSAFLFASSAVVVGQLSLNGGQQYLLNQAVDMSADFADMSNVFFFADSLAQFDTSSASGKIKWKRHNVVPRQAFNTNGQWQVPLDMLDFPTPAYDNDPVLDFDIDFISERTIRLRVYTSDIRPAQTPEVMINGELPTSSAWKVSESNDEVTYKSAAGSITVSKYPWRIVLRDAEGRVIQKTRVLGDNDTTQVK